MDLSDRLDAPDDREPPGAVPGAPPSAARGRGGPPRRGRHRALAGPAGARGGPPGAHRRPDAGFTGRLLFPVCAFAVWPPVHRLGRRTVVEVAEIAHESLLRLKRQFGCRRWADAACQVAHVRPNVLLESAAPHTQVALVQAGYGTAALPSTVRVPAGDLRVAALLQNGAPLGGWAALSWNARRLLPRFAERFGAELEAYARRAYPGRAVIRRAPRVPRPPDPGARAPDEAP